MRSYFLSPGKPFPVQSAYIGRVLSPPTLPGPLRKLSPKSCSFLWVEKNLTTLLRNPKPEAWCIYPWKPDADTPWNLMWLALETCSKLLMTQRPCSISFFPKYLFRVWLQILQALLLDSPVRFLPSCSYFSQPAYFLLVKMLFLVFTNIITNAKHCILPFSGALQVAKAKVFFTVFLHTYTK